MERHIESMRRFEQEVVPQQAELFERLAGGQKPRTLFICCSDSRVDPSLMFNEPPGEIFVIRNAGNILRPYSVEHPDGNLATVEYAVAALEVKNVIVCGHSGCGAITGLIQPEALDELPLVRRWVQVAEPVRRIVKLTEPNLSGPELIERAVYENVKVQLFNLRTHPWVAARVEHGALKLYGWVKDIRTGEMKQYDRSTNSWGPLCVSPSLR